VFKVALRTIRLIGDSILRKKSEPVEKIDDEIIALLQDMAETMYYTKGIGLAAPQIGELKRVVVIDTGDGIINLINPVITRAHGSQAVREGCLSIPDTLGRLTRPAKVTVRALNEKGEKIIIPGENVLAKAFCHEIDHLDGILYIDRATNVEFLNCKEKS
jgi:peptide deformylase